MNSPLAPVGVFDSGVGGLTVARAIIDQLPDEDIVYVGDTGNGPYGPLTIPEIRAHALAIGDDLVGRGVKALVIACNSASSACLRDARERYQVPVVEVILPAVRRAVAATRNGRIGVIGTRATITSHAYQDAFAAARDTEITAVACPRFVDFVERGVTSGRQVLGLAQGYLEPLQRAEVDTLVLGCTHYPLLSGLIQLAMGENVTLVSSAEETAKEVVRVLTEIDLLRPHDAPPATRIFEATGDPEAFTKLAARFLGPVPWWWWPLAFALAALIAFEVNLGVAALPDWVPFATLFTVAAGTLLWLGRVEIRVTAGSADGAGVKLWAGPAHLPVAVIARSAEIPATAKSAALGRQLDPAAYVLHRAWVGPMVLVVLDDPNDPTPYWLVSCRHPERVLSALRS